MASRRTRAQIQHDAAIARRRREEEREAATSKRNEAALNKFITVGPDFTIHQSMDKVGKYHELMHILVDVVGHGDRVCQMDDALLDLAGRDAKTQEAAGSLFNIYYATRFLAATKNFDLLQYIATEFAMYEANEVSLLSAYGDLMGRPDVNYEETPPVGHENSVIYMYVDVVRQIYKELGLNEEEHRDRLPRIVADAKCNLQDWLKKIGYKGPIPKARPKPQKKKQACPLFEQLATKGPVRPPHAPRQIPEDIPVEKAVALVWDDDYTHKLCWFVHNITKKDREKGKYDRLAMDIFMMARNLNRTLDFNLEAYLQRIKDDKYRAIDVTIEWELTKGPAPELISAALTILQYAVDNRPRPAICTLEPEQWSTTMQGYHQFQAMNDNYRPPSPTQESGGPDHAAWNAWCTELNYESPDEDAEVVEEEEEEENEEEEEEEEGDGGGEMEDDEEGEDIAEDDDSDTSGDGTGHHKKVRVRGPHGYQDE